MATITRGRPTTGPLLAPHGTRARYVHRTQACRCEACKAANRAYIARWRAGGTNHRDGDVWRPRNWRQLELPGVAR